MLRFQTFMIMRAWARFAFSSAARDFKPDFLCIADLVPPLLQYWQEATMRKFLLITLLLGGCAENFVATRPDAVDFDQAYSDCLYRRSTSGDYGPRVYYSCMRARGWVVGK